MRYALIEIYPPSICECLFLWKASPEPAAWTCCPLAGTSHRPSISQGCPELVALLLPLWPAQNMPGFPLPTGSWAFDGRKNMYAPFTQLVPGDEMQAEASREAGGHRLSH